MERGLAFRPPWYGKLAKAICSLFVPVVMQPGSCIVVVQADVACTTWEMDMGLEPAAARCLAAISNAARWHKLRDLYAAAPWIVCHETWRAYVRAACAHR